MRAQAGGDIDMSKKTLILLTFVAVAVLAIGHATRPESEPAGGIPLPPGWSEYQADKDKSTGRWDRGYWVED
jgi:hypothetical protein